MCREPALAEGGFVGMGGGDNGLDLRWKGSAGCKDGASAEGFAGVFTDQQGRHRWSAEPLPDGQQFGGMIPRPIKGDKPVSPPAEVFDGVVAMLRERYSAHLPVIPGARETVRRLATAGFTLAVASSSPLVLIEFLVERLALADCFDLLVSSDAVDKGKPEPDVYEYACAQLGVQPGDAAAVEDSASGIMAAVSAGLFVVAVPNQAFPPPDAVLARADRVVASLPEVASLFLD